MTLNSVLHFGLLINCFARCVSVWLDESGGYRDLTIALDSAIQEIDCHLLLNQAEKLATVFSEDLWTATEGKLYVASVDVVVSNESAERCNVSNAGGRRTWTNADIRLRDRWHVTEKWSPEGSVGVGVQQPLGCGRHGDFIAVAYSALLSISDDEDADNKNSSLQSEGEEFRKLGRALVAAWAKYRWGVFEEVGGDPSGDSARCQENDEFCSYVSEEKSIMANVAGNLSFCNIATHNALQPTPQNLACMGQSVWEVMKKHPDFKSTQELHLENEYKYGEKFKDAYEENMNELQAFQGWNSLQDTSQTVDEMNRQNLAVEESPYLTVVVEEEGAKRRIERDVGGTGDGGPTTTAETSATEDTKSASFIGTLPPLHLQDRKEKALHESEGNVDRPDSLPSVVHQDKSPQSVSWVTAVQTPAALSRASNHSIKWIRTKDLVNVKTTLLPKIPESENDLNHRPQPPRIRLISPPSKAVVVALDLSSFSVAEASVEWLRGGILRWLFGVGHNVNIGILASYSDTSFPLSLGPLGPGPTSARLLEEHMALLPYQHEVDDNVYGGKFCLPCVIQEAEKMLKGAGVSLQSGVLILTVCQPQLSMHQIQKTSSSFLAIHTITICPNAPLYIEKLPVAEGSWALSSVSMETGISAEIQLGHVLTEITRETLLWPTDSRLQTIHEEEKQLRNEEIETDGAFRSITGTIKVPKSKTTKLFVITSSSATKVAELWSGRKRHTLHRDTTRRYWSLLEGETNILSYTLKFLATSLELPLTLSTGLYEKSEETAVRVRLRTSTRHYRPDNPLDPYLTVWTEVTKDGNPVIDADVTISVTYVSGHAPSTYSLMLLDNGSTEPDIRAGDGIYSRYLTWIPGTGRYILTARASDTASTRLYTNENGTATQTRMGRFKVFSASISLVVESAPSGDFFPPSRISDLKVAPLYDSLVNITWSAPGGDLDQGSAWRYQLKMYTEIAALKDDKFDSSGIEVYCKQGEERAPTPAPALFGTPQYCVTSIPFPNLQWYFAIRAIDGANNTGKISNIVSTYVFEATTPSSASQLSFSEEIVQNVMMSTMKPKMTEPNKDEDSWRLYGIALVAAIAFVMLSISVFACIICCRKAKAKAAQDTERPIYKIYVNNAYIQEDDKDIKVINKDKVLEKDPTLQWINSLDNYTSGDAVKDENPADISGDMADSNNPAGKFAKPVRFGVLTNGSIMRELPSSSSSSSSKPSDEAVHDDFKYKDLSEANSDSTSDEATGSTFSAATEITTAEAHWVKDPVKIPFKSPPSNSPYESSYQPLGIPTLPGPTVISIRCDSNNSYNSDEEGGFRPRSALGHGPAKHLSAQFSSFRCPTAPDEHKMSRRSVNYSPTFNHVSRSINPDNTALPHGTVRSVKKRRHISFV